MELNEITNRINDSGFLSKYDNSLGTNDSSFLKRVYNTSLTVYADRLKAIGFEKLDTVLDAGCGFGQWALAMSVMNKNVHCIDTGSERLMVLNDLCNFLSIKNISTQHAILSKLPFEENSFDAIFCYSAIFIDNPFDSLKEFYRVLKPGGKLYVNANGLGFQLYLWHNKPNATSDFDPRKNVAKAFQNTVNFLNNLPKADGQIIIEKEQMEEMLQSVGFKQNLTGAEGTINLKPNEISIKPFFKGDYFGFTGVYEILSTK